MFYLRRISVGINSPLVPNRDSAAFSHFELGGLIVPSLAPDNIEKMSPDIVSN